MGTYSRHQLWISLGPIQHLRRERAVDGPEMLGLLPIEAQRLRPRPDGLLYVRTQVGEMAAWQRPQLGDRITAVGVAEPSRDQVAHFFGDRPIAGDLAADDGDDTGYAVASSMVVQRVFARHLALVDVLDAHQRADAGPRVVDLRK